MIKTMTSLPNLEHGSIIKNLSLKMDANLAWFNVKLNCVCVIANVFVICKI